MKIRERMDIYYISALVTIFSGILACLEYFFGFFAFSLRKIKSIVNTDEKRNKALIIHFENNQFPELSNWWHMGSLLSNPAMQIVSNLLVTNNTDKQIILTGSLLKTRSIRGQVLTKATNGRLYGTENHILPNSTTKISLNFWIQPPFIKKEANFVSDVAVIDNYGRKHWIRKVEFKHM